jgi:phage tail sheath protein FI
MPGVNVTTVTRTGPTAPNLAPSGQLFMAGLAERGSTTAPVLIRGLADFESKFGGRVSYSHLYDNIATFFEEGGSQAYVIRTVGPSATKGEVDVPDRGTPSASDTINFEAKNAGAWSSGVTITVDDLTGGNVEFVVTLDGTTVERYVATTVAEVVSAFADSQYVVATSLGSATVAPNNMPAEGTYTLSAGADDRAAVTATHYTASLALFTLGLGDGAVAIPGVGISVHAALIAHANANRRIAILSHSETATVSDLTTAADGLNSEYAGLFAPWVQISTPSGTKFTSPEGYVAAVRNRAHVEAGPWRAPAGQIAVARSVIGLKYEYDRTVGDSLDTNKVSAIRLINNTVRLYGWRSLSDDTANYALLIGRDTLNYLVWASEARLEQYVFQTVDGKGQLLSAINGTLVGILEPIRQTGGLFERFNANGDLLDPGYLVETGSTVNTLVNLANNEVRARVSVRVSPAAALISVTIVKVGLLSNL